LFGLPVRRFYQFFPEEEKNIRDNKDIFPKFFEANQFTTRAKTMTYLVNLREEDYREILGEKRTDEYDAGHLINLSREVVRMYNEKRFVDYGKFLDALIFTNFGDC
jgi:hypothetical protein